MACNHGDGWPPDETKWTARVSKDEIVPREASAIPDIRQLLSRLDYENTHSLRYRLFWNCIRYAPQGFRTADGTRGTAFLTWEPLDPEHGLNKLTCVWLFRYDNGRIFWPDDPQHPNHNKLRFSRDEKQILGLMKQVFYRINQQAEQESRWNGRHGKTATNTSALLDKMMPFDLPTIGPALSNISASRQDAEQVQKSIVNTVDRTVFAQSFHCVFDFAGCRKTFDSRTDWKRHTLSQHLCLRYYRCEICAQVSTTQKTRNFKRKDLFTEHVRRMHMQPSAESAGTDGGPQSKSEIDIQKMRETSLVQDRQPPLECNCPRPDCMARFEGPAAWDDWIEHVGWHMEKGEGDHVYLDQLLREYALNEGIIEKVGDDQYKLCSVS